MRSLRGRLTATTLLATLGLISISGLVLDNRVRRQLENSLDAELEAKAETVIGLTEQENGEVLVEFADIYVPNLSRQESVEIQLEGGRLLARSARLGDFRLTADGRLSMRPRFRDLELPGGRPGRLIQIDFLPLVEGAGDSVLAEPAPPEDPSRRAGRPVVTALVAVDKGATLAQIRDFRVTLGLISLLLLAGLGVLVPYLVGRGMRPLTDLGAQVQRLDASNLGEPLVMGAEPPGELRPLIARLDDLRGRLARSFERERRFSSDVAHELRTPIAELRVLAEVALRYPPDPKESAQFYRDALETTLRMEHLAGQLLALARLEGSGASPLFSALPLRESLLAVAARRDAGGDCRLEVPERAKILANATLFDLLLDNILGNALDHRIPGTPVEIAVSPLPDAWRLAVRNRTADLEPADLEHLFERFWRKDSARRGDRHSGLGLALVRSIAEVLGIQIAIALENGTFEIALVIPAAPR